MTTIQTLRETSEALDESIDRYTIWLEALRFARGYTRNEISAKYNELKEKLERINVLKDAIEEGTELVRRVESYTLSGGFDNVVCDLAGELDQLESDKWAFDAWIEVLAKIVEVWPSTKVIERSILEVNQKVKKAEDQQARIEAEIDKLS